MERLWQEHGGYATGGGVGAEATGPVDRGALVDALRRFSIESDRFVEIFSSAHGLHRTDMNALAYISAADEAGHPLSPGQLGAELNLSSPATTALLDRLERVGHVGRERDASDRRKVVVRTQEQGIRLAVEFFVPLGRALRQVMDSFDEDELRVVLRFLQQAADAVEATRRAQ
jgi:DNA-binding MarR family transcriptional regulator